MLLVGPDRVDVVTGVHSGPVMVRVEVRTAQPTTDEFTEVDVDEVQLTSGSSLVWVRGPMDLPTTDPLPGLAGEIGVTVIGRRDDSSYDLATNEAVEEYLIALWPFSGEQLRRQAHSRAAQERS